MESPVRKNFTSGRKLPLTERKIVSASLKPQFDSKGIFHPSSQLEYSEIIRNAGDKLVVVKMGADWCPPCKALAPLLEKLAAETTNVVFIAVDVDKCPEVASQLKVSGIPDTRIFKNRIEMAKVVGCDIQSITTHLQANSTDQSAPVLKDTQKKE